MDPNPPPTGIFLLLTFLEIMPTQGSHTALGDPVRFRLNWLEFFCLWMLGQTVENEHGSQMHLTTDVGLCLCSIEQPSLQQNLTCSGHALLHVSNYTNTGWSDRVGDILGAGENDSFYQLPEV